MLQIFLPNLFLIYIVVVAVVLCFGHALRHVGSQFPDQGSNPRPLQWQRGVLTTGRPWKPPGDLMFSLQHITPKHLGLLDSGPQAPCRLVWVCSH